MTARRFTHQTKVVIQQTDQIEVIEIDGMVCVELHKRSLHNESI